MRHLAPRGQTDEPPVPLLAAFCIIASAGASGVGLGRLGALSGGYNEESRNGQPIGGTGLFAQARANVMPIPDRRAGPAGLPILRQAESGWKVVLPRTREDHLRQACPAGVGTRVGAVAVTAHPGFQQMAQKRAGVRHGGTNGVAARTACLASAEQACQYACSTLILCATRTSSPMGPVERRGRAPRTAEAHHQTP
jgi:hypothetical protein